MNGDERHELITQIRIVVAELRKEVSLRFESTDKALMLQASEYDRRLAILNHEAEQLKAMQKTYIPRETYAALEKDVSEMKSWIDKEKGARTINALLSGIAIIIAALTLAVTLFTGGTL